MHYSNHDRRRHLEQSQVKVAVLADSLSQEKATEQRLQDLVWIGAISMLLLAAYGAVLLG